MEKYSSLILGGLLVVSIAFNAFQYWMAGETKKKLRG